MRDKPQQNPADIAREAFRQLAIRRIAPTPDAYRQIYFEIAGAAEERQPDKTLEAFASFVTSMTGEVSFYGQRLQKAAKAPPVLS